MCGRISCTLHPSRVGRIGKAEKFQGTEYFRPKYNLTPKNTALIVRECSRNSREVCGALWGLVARFKRLGKSDCAYNTINARSETIASSPLYGPLLNKNRCVVLADGFYEWKTAKTLGKSQKVPYFFRVKKTVEEKPIPFYQLDESTELIGEKKSAKRIKSEVTTMSQHEKSLSVIDEATELCANELPSRAFNWSTFDKHVLSDSEMPLMMAGLYDVTVDDISGKEQMSFTILTMESDKTHFFEVHHRMPVILNPETASLWLACEFIKFNECIKVILQESNTLAAKSMEFYEVPSLVSSIQNNLFECTIQKCEYQSQQMAKLFRSEQSGPSKATAATILLGKKEETSEAPAKKIDYTDEISDLSTAHPMKLKSNSEIALLESTPMADDTDTKSHVLKIKKESNTDNFGTENTISSTATNKTYNSMNQVVKGCNVSQTIQSKTTQKISDETRADAFVPNPAKTSVSLTQPSPKKHNVEKLEYSTPNTKITKFFKKKA